jgi:hypothetical protein
VSQDLADLCKRQLHPMTGDNVYTQPSTGRRECKACKADYRRARRAERGEPADMCRKGLHDLADEENVYTRPSDGRRECKPCKTDAATRRKGRRAAKAAKARAEAERLRAEEARAVPLPPPAGVRTWGGARGQQAAAEYRLARLVRATRRP